MKITAFIVALLLPLLASAGSYENMEAALIRGESDTAIDLVKHGMDVNTVNRDGNTLLIQAMQKDMSPLFDFLLRNRARLNIRNKNGETALSIAAFGGKLAYVKKLVDAGAEINFFGWAPLAYAAYNGHLEVVDYLLKHGAEIDATTENGSTALLFAARFGHENVIDLLLKNNADPTIANERGETAVDWAVKGGNSKIEDKLRAAGGRSGKAVQIELSK